MVKEGVIAIEGSSKSGDSSSEESDFDTNFGSRTSREAEAFMESAPLAQELFRHVRTSIARDAIIGASKTSCGRSLSQNFKSLERSGRIRFPKCQKCFEMKHIESAPKRPRIL